MDPEITQTKLLLLAYNTNARTLLESFIVLLTMGCGFKQDKYITDTKCSTCPSTKTTFQGNNTSGNFIPRKL